MFKLIFSTIKQKRKIFAGTFVSIVLAIMLLTICWNLLFSAISGEIRGGEVSYLASISLFGTISAVTIFAAIFVIIGTTSFSVQQRWNDIALLRGIGLTPSQVKRMLGREMNLIAILGFLLGTPLGLIAAPLLLKSFIHLGVIPAKFQYSVTSLNLFAVFCLGLIVLRISAYFSSKSISEVSPTEALRAATLSTKKGGKIKTFIGSIFMFGAISILCFLPQTGAAGIGYNFLASICFIIGTALIGDIIIYILGSIMRGIFSLFGATGYLSSANSKRYSQRMANAAVGITMMIALNGGILMNTLAFNNNSIETQNSYYDHNTVLAQADGFHLKQLMDIKRIFKNDIVDAFVECEIDHYGLNGNKYKYDDYDAIGVLNDYDFNQVSVSRKFADQFHVNIGDTVEIIFNGKNKVLVDVVDIHSAGAYEKADFIASYSLIVNYNPYAQIKTVIIRSGKPQISNKLSELEKLWPETKINLSKKTTGNSNVQTQSIVIYMMIAISLVFSIIAVINTLFISTASRSSEYRNLWLIGLTPKQIRNMLNMESSIVIFVGVFMGALINFLCVGTFNRANGYMQTLFGNTSIYFSLIALGLFVGIIVSRIATSIEVSRSIGQVRFE